MGIRVEHNPVIIPYAEAQYQAALRQRAQEDAARRQQNQMQRLQMEAQRQGMGIQQQQADLAREQFEAQRGPAQEMQRLQMDSQRQSMGIQQQQADMARQQFEAERAASQQPRPVPGPQGVQQGQQSGAAPQPIEQPDIPRNYAGVLQTAMQQDAITQRAQMRQAGEIERMHTRNALDLRSDWVKRQLDLEFQDMELTMKDRRNLEEIFRGETELRDALMSGRINEEQFQDAHAQLQSRLFGIEGMPTQKPPWPEEQDTGRTWMEENTGALMTRDHNGNVKVLVPSAKEESERKVQINATAVRRRAEQIVQQRVQQGGMEEVVDALGNVADPEAYEQMIQEAMPEAHSQIANEEMMTNGLNESFGQEPQQAQGAPVMPSPEQFEQVASSMSSLPQEHQQALMNAYETFSAQAEQQPEFAAAAIREIITIYSLVDELAGVDEQAHRRALALLESVFGGSPNAEESMEQLKQLLGA